MSETKYEAQRLDELARILEEGITKDEWPEIKHEKVDELEQAHELTLQLCDLMARATQSEDSPERRSQISEVWGNACSLMFAVGDLNRQRFRESLSL